MEMKRKATKPLGKAKALTIEQVRAITTILARARDDTDLRDLALFRTALDTMLRISDLLALRVGDVRDTQGAIKNELVLCQKKTKGGVTCDLGDVARKSIEKYLEERSRRTRVGDGAHLFPISIRQAQRIAKRLMMLVSIDPTRYSPHSWRRTKASIIYKQTGNIEAVRQLLGHSSVVATSAYLDVSVGDALELTRSISF